MNKAKELVSTNSVVQDILPILHESEAASESIRSQIHCCGIGYREGRKRESNQRCIVWTGQRTVPNVFIGGNHIGGCDQTTGLHQEGKLVPLLTDAGAVAKATA
uniref:Uncharacterized protein n=1 Tax=Salix viminalis TaxID=40686 RepID=A0A6N2MJ69_SALVM